MTTDLPAGREMDALVAEKIMGWARSAGMPAWVCDPGAIAVVHPKGGRTILEYRGAVESMPEDVDQRMPRYSTDIAAAWTVVEKLCPDHDGEFRLERNVDGHQGTGWEAHFGYHTGNVCRNVYGHGDTAPLAICRAALSAVKANP